MPSCKWYSQGLIAAVRKEWNWEADTMKLALLTDVYTPDLDFHDAWDDVSAYETSGTAYVAGGQSLTSRTIFHDSGANIIRLGADNVTWGTATFTARWGVVYDDSPALAADKVLLGLVDLDSNQSPAGENFSVVWDSTDKILRISVTH